MSHIYKKILITGATGTIGQSIAKTFAAPGVSMAIQFHKAHDKAENLKEGLERRGSSVFAISANLSKPSEAEKLVSKSIKLMDGIDLMIHTAAMFERTPLGEVAEKEWDAVINLNLKASFFLAQAAAMSMQSTGGHMIFISDVAAQRPYAGYLPYCMSKAGIDALVKGLAKALAPKILVNAVAPYVVTRPKNLSDNGWNDILAKTSLQRPSKPEEIAAIVKMIAESGETITGQIIAVDGGRTLR